MSETLLAGRRSDGLDFTEFQKAVATEMRSQGIIAPYTIIEYNQNRFEQCNHAFHHGRSPEAIAREIAIDIRG